MWFESEDVTKQLKRRKQFRKYMRFFIIKQFRRKKVLKKTKNNIIMRQIEYKQSFKLHYPSKRDRHWMLWKNFSGSILAGGPFNRRYIKDIRWYFY